MRKLFALVLTLVLVLMATACKAGKEDAQSPAVNEPTLQENSSAELFPEGVNVTEAEKESIGIVSLNDLMNASPTDVNELYLMGSSDTEYWVSGYYGTSPILVIPEEYQGAPITAVTQYALGASSVAEALRINDSCTELQDFACYGSEFLKIVVFGSNVKSVGESAFMNCGELETVVLNEGLEDVAFAAFAGCKNLESITIPETVTNIEAAVFQECHEDFTIYGEAGSYAETFAAENGIPFVAQ